MKKILVLATMFAVAVSINVANAQMVVSDPVVKSDEMHVTAFPGGQLISITGYSGGVFSPRVTTVTRLLCIGNTPCTPLGTGDVAQGASAASSVIAPLIEAAGFVGGNAVRRPTNIISSVSAKVGDGSPVNSNNPTSNSAYTSTQTNSNNGNSSYNSNYNLNDYNNSFNNPNSNNNSGNGSNNNNDYTGGGKG